MQRLIMADLIRWKEQKNRIPLILKGVRQCGKTYVLKEFGTSHFPRMHYFNFEQDNRLAPIFEGPLDPKKLLFELSLLINMDINHETDFIFFDEIQTCPRALTSLKYFCEDLPQAAVCGAGSLLGLHLNVQSFPVGKVQFLTLHPMSFTEFLLAIGQQKLFDFLHTLIPETSEVPLSIHQTCWEFLKKYFVIGGMPSAVKIYVDLQDSPYEALQKVRDKQLDLITAYQADIAKHAGKVNAMHIDRVWRDVPAQLARAQDGSAQKFKFKGILPGIDRYQRLADTIDWLCAAQLVIKVPVVDTARIPLPAYVKENTFKLYMMDVGLLGAMSQLPVKAILDQDYGSYKGYFAENYVAQALLSAGSQGLYGWADGRSEVEFLQLDNADIIPIEVKSGNVTRAKSLQIYAEKYQPPYQIIFSAKPPSLQGDFVRHYPLYFAEIIKFA
ncbi:MAG: ATP-binding protein [Gammaproteobacteria bacterium]